MEVELITTHVSLILLALASVLNLPLLGHQHSASRKLQKLSSFFLLLSCIFLTASFAMRWQNAGYLPRSRTELGFVASVAWLGLFAQARLEMRRMQALVAPLVMFLLAVHLGMEWSRVHVGQSLGSAYLACHIAGAIAGEVLAVAAAVIALFYLVQRRFLKEKAFAKLMLKLPALDLLDDLLIVALGAGFLFLSVALLSGAIFLWHLDPHERSGLTVKLIWALTVWIWYFAALFSRIAMQFSTKGLAQMSLLGFLLLVGAYFGFIF